LTQETTEIEMVTTYEFGSRYFQIEFRLSVQQVAATQLLILS